MADSRKSVKGRTIGDVLAAVIRTPFRVVLARLLILLGVLIAAITALRFVGVKRLGLIEYGPTREVQFADEPGVILSSRSRNRSQYLLVVPASQSWWPTAIKVSEGDSLEFEASGNVQISLMDLIDRAQLRYRVESTLVGRHMIDTVREAPEDKFDPAQDAAIRLPRPWVGPAGDTAGSLTDHAYSQRSRRKVMPGQPYGGVVGAIVDSGKMRPDSAAIFWIGLRTQSRAGRSGVLWFTVNDVLWKDNRFYDDNIGYFLVKVTVSRR